MADDYGTTDATGNWFDNNPLPSGFVPLPDPAAASSGPVGDQSTGLALPKGFAVPAYGNPNGVSIGPGGTTTNSAASGPPTGGNLSDPTYAAQLVAYYAKQPGANPSLTTDPNYWIQKITSGELGSDVNYIVGRFMTPEGAPAGSSSTGGMATVGQLGSFAQPYGVDFTAPSAADARNTPGYQFSFDQGVAAVDAGAAAKGTLGTGGTEKALDTFGTGLADTTYQQTYQNALQQYMNSYNIWRNQQTDVWGRLNDVSNRGLTAATSATA